MCIFVVKYRPFKEKLNQITNIITEFGVLVTIVISGAYLFEISDTLKTAVDFVIVCIIFAILLINLVVSLTKMFK